MPVRRRGHEAGGRRDNRIKVAYNDDELAIVQAAAERENQALTAWIGRTSLVAATEKLVPVSTDAKDVISELVQGRNQLSRIGNNLNQVAKALNSDAVVSDAQLRAVLGAVEAAARRVDEATLQVMRERKSR